MNYQKFGNNSHHTFPEPIFITWITNLLFFSPFYSLTVTHNIIITDTSHRGCGKLWYRDITRAGKVFAAAFVPTIALEEASQKCNQVLWRKKCSGVSDTESRLRSRSHVTPTGNDCLRDLHFKVLRVNSCLRGTGRSKTSGGSEQLTEADLKAEVPEQSEPLYFGVIITHCGQLTMLLVEMIDSRISNPLCWLTERLGRRSLNHTPAMLSRGPSHAHTHTHKGDIPLNFVSDHAHIPEQMMKRTI